MKKIRKAVFPVAGLGTRFLPATKASPKEMLPIVDKPLIQYAAEEAMAAGVTELIFITGRNKRSIEDHFDKAYELEDALEKGHKEELLEILRSVLPKGVSCVYIRQPEALGLGHAVLCARSVVGDEPFAVILADDLIDPDLPAMKEMVEVFHQQQCSILGVERVSLEEVINYGIVDTFPIADHLLQLKSIIEKPNKDEAPSNLAVVGRYLLTPDIFNCLTLIKPGKGGEIQLTDGIAQLIKKERVLAHRFQGRRFDCGSKLGFMKANIELAMRHQEIGDMFKQYLHSLSP